MYTAFIVLCFSSRAVNVCFSYSRNLKSLHSCPIADINPTVMQACSRSGRCAFRAKLSWNPRASKRMMQDEEACHVKKQMRDIPETLQDKMGQKMRLTVNGFAVKSPARLLSTTLLSSVTHTNHCANISKMHVYLCTCRKPILNTDAE